MRVLKTLAIAGATAIASVASAAPVPVSIWSYTVTSAFLNPATFAGVPITPNIDTPTLLAWGNIDATHPAQSQLEIAGSPATDCAYNTIAGFPGCAATPPFPPVVFVPPGPIHTTLSGDPLPAYLDGEIGLTQTFIHRNNTIPTGSSTLDEVTVRTTLSLTPTVPGALPGFGPVPLDILVNFQETPNAGPCVDATPTPCADIFVIEGGLNRTFWYNGNTGAVSLVDPLNADFNRYFVQIFPFQGTPLNPLSAAACAAAGAAFPCQGFKTQEGQVNAVQFAFAITTDPIGTVPEPGTLVLFALGLLGLGLTVRRQA